MTAPAVDDRLDELIGEHRSVLLARAVTLTAGDFTWAEDAVQETFIRAWRHIDRMSAEYGSVRAWLIRVMHNVVMDGYRARRARPTEIDERHLDVEPGHEVTEQVEAAMLVDDALASLDDSHRQVLEYTYLRDQTIADAARELRIPVGTVKSRMFYALRRVRETASTPSDEEHTS